LVSESGNSMKSLWILSKTISTLELKARCKADFCQAWERWAVVFSHLYFSRKTPACFRNTRYFQSITGNKILKRDKYKF
jgi:hypothetical protein